MKIFHSRPPTKQQHPTNKNISFYSGAFYISLNRRYSTGTTNIGETNRIYTYYQY